MWCWSVKVLPAFAPQLEMLRWFLRGRFALVIIWKFHIFIFSPSTLSLFHTWPVHPTHHLNFSLFHTLTLLIFNTFALSHFYFLHFYFFTHLHLAGSPSSSLYSTTFEQQLVSSFTSVCVNLDLIVKLIKSTAIHSALCACVLLEGRISFNLVHQGALQVSPHNDSLERMTNYVPNDHRDLVVSDSVDLESRWGQANRSK